jgi:predicted nuclease of predicted toxin-antitoxin system
MKVLVDENIPLITVEELRLKGFDVIDIRGSAEQGITDEVLWQKAQQEKRLYITTDKGFSIHRDEAHHGILIVRLRQPTRLKIHQRVIQAITKYFGLVFLYPVHPVDPVRKDIFARAALPARRLRVGFQAGGAGACAACCTVFFLN